MKEIKEDALDGLDVQYVSRMEEGLDQVLESEPVRNPEAFFRVPDGERKPIPNGQSEATEVVVA